MKYILMMNGKGPISRDMPSGRTSETWLSYPGVNSLVITLTKPEVTYHCVLPFKALLSRGH